VRKEQLDSGLAAKSDTGHSHGATYAPVSHTHAGADINSGTVAVGRLPTGTSGSTVALGDHTHSGFAAASHVHSGADITSGTVPIAAIPTGTSGTTVALGNHDHASVYAALAHAHAAGDVTSGTFNIARLPTGTSSSTVVVGNDERLSVKPYPPVVLTDASTVVVNAALGNHFRLTTGSSRQFGTPSNPVDGQVITFEIKATAGITVTFTTAYTFGSDVTGATATVSGKTDFIQFVYCASVSKWVNIGYIKGLTT
jgi:hypothetical protein